MQGRKILDLSGRRFGRLVVLEPLARRSSNGSVRWQCRCDCGNVGDHKRDDLLSGGSESCGCLRRELLQKRMRTHGLSKTPMYKVWGGIIQRCENPNDQNFKWYGGKGIRICKRWRNSFEAFLADVGERPGPGLTIDRIEARLGYRPGNIRWATAGEQRENATKRTHCIRGHRLSDDNTYLLRGHRRCRECRRMNNRRLSKRARAA